MMTIQDADMPGLKTVVLYGLGMNKTDDLDRHSDREARELELCPLIILLTEPELKDSAQRRAETNSAEVKTPRWSWKASWTGNNAYLKSYHK